MSRIATLAVFATFVTACASQVMGKYIGQDIREVAIVYGPPSNAFDYGANKRVFQWASVNESTTPTRATTTGTADVVGDSVWMNSNTQITGGQTVTDVDICSYIATWDDNAQSWIVTEVRTPKGIDSLGLGRSCY